MKNFIIYSFLYCILSSWDCQSFQKECFWQSCKALSESDTFYSVLENRIFLHQDTIFNQHLLIKQGLKGNRILAQKVRYTDTFIINQDSVIWQNYSVTGLFFNEASFVREDTIYYLRTRTGFPPEPVQLIPIEKVTRQGRILYKYKSSISHLFTQLDFLDPMTIFDGTYTIEDGYYYIHPIIGVVERVDNYHLPGRQVNQFYSSNDKICAAILDSLELKLNMK
ncbi:MAG: hypothetical protein EP332_08610 [Bacteroidetes bacterium]|nr:MAG: hypothetical protein EP332_08610 [Bacteroidota bacterium]